MKFNRRLKPFQAISFDLDDTLYHNAPIMVAAAKKMSSYFTKMLPARPQGAYDHHYWFSFRKQVLQAQPQLRDDIGLLRLHCYSHGLNALGFSQGEADQMAKQAWQYFMAQRSDFKVPLAIHQLLKALNNRWPLVAITNGNVDIKKIGLGGYFAQTYHASINFPSKPSPSMFNLACQHLAISANQLLHVGDCGHSDIYGANRTGCQSAWLSRYPVGKPITSLPTLELADISELHQLL